MSVLYLWKNRVRPGIFTKRWLKVWAKRLLNTPGLIEIFYRNWRHKIKGVRIGTLSIVGKIDMNGPPNRLSIGDHSSIANTVHMALHEKIIIGSRVTINNDVKLLTASHDVSSISWLMFAKPIILKDYSWIACNAIILPGVVIGEGAVVGAGSVVTKDIADYTIVAGNPAKIIGKRCTTLSYRPVDFCAPFEAWLGISTKQ